MSEGEEDDHRDQDESVKDFGFHSVVQHTIIISVFLSECAALESEGGGRSYHSCNHPALL
jgi:hypothetical protein